MLSKRYESTEVDRRTWLHVPSGKSGAPDGRFHNEFLIMSAEILISNPKS